MCVWGGGWGGVRVRGGGVTVNLGRNDQLLVNIALQCNIHITTQTIRSAKMFMSVCLILLICAWTACACG